MYTSCTNAVDTELISLSCTFYTIENLNTYQCLHLSMAVVGDGLAWGFGRGLAAVWLVRSVGRVWMACSSSGALGLGVW